MSAPLRVGLVQLTSDADLEANVARACALIEEAADAGATLVATPENTDLMTASRADRLAKARGEADHPGLPAFSDLAARRRLWLLIGSLGIRLEGEERLANRSFLFGPDGGIAARYDKIHMFDVEIPDGQSYRESATFHPGEAAVIADLPAVRLGMTICYDLRFPHLYRKLAQAGAEVLSVPAAFTRFTGQAHWHVLLRARAIETGCWVIAPAQCGVHPGDRRTFGHSLVVAPWGEVTADAGEAPGVVVTDLDMARLHKARGMVPSLGHDRDFRL